MKRLADKWRLDADFQAAYRADPEGTLAQTGMDIPPEAFRLIADADEGRQLLRDLQEGRCTPDALPREFLLYQSAVREVHERYNELGKDRCVPYHDALRLWRERQHRRCRLQFGSAARNMREAPLMYELSEGCSVGCPFCGAAAKGLQGVFRYTPEHAPSGRRPFPACII